MHNLTPNELRDIIERKESITRLLANLRYSVAVERPGSDLWQAYHALARAEGDLRRLCFEMLRRRG